MIVLAFSLTVSRRPAGGDARSGQSGRSHTLLRAGTIIVDGRRELCLIRNISSLGLMLHVYAKLEAGQRVEVELKTGQQVAGRIKWIEGSDAGIEFDLAIDVMAMLASHLVTGSDHKPRMPRVEVRCPATLRMGSHSYRVETRDISQGGAKIGIAAALPADADVVLSMEGFPSLHGVVRWCNGDAAGVTFNAIIPWPQLVCWLKERREVGPPKAPWRARPSREDRHA